MGTTTPEYLKLINEFPLRFIKDRETNETALKVIVELAQREIELTDSEMEYFELLADLVQAYERGAFFQHKKGNHFVLSGLLEQRYLSARSKHARRSQNNAKHHFRTEL